MEPGPIHQADRSAPSPESVPLGPRVLIAAGGTGGHIYPAIAIADALRQLSPRTAIEFAGTRDRMEWDVVPRAGYAIHPIRAAGIDRKRRLRNARLPLKLAGGLLDSWRLIRGFDPHVVVGTGGYVTGPVLFVAGLMGKPTVIQEQNAYAGVTNRLLARRASRVHVAFREAAEHFPADRCELSGNPTRTALLEIDRETARQAFHIPLDARVLFVVGGSLGAAAINRGVARHLDALLSDASLHILWQTGRLYYEEMLPAADGNDRVRLMQYVDRMDLAYGASDLVLSRAGAITCSELLVTRKPAVLVPSPNVAEDHQTKNARAMRDGGSAMMLPETELDDRLAEIVGRLLADPEALARMAERAGALARPDAAVKIARNVLETAGWTTVEKTETR